MVRVRQQVSCRSNISPAKLAIGSILNPMTRFDDWPLWMRVLVGVPHVLLAGILAWVWRPLRGRAFYWAVGLFVYLCVFYLVFVRK